jgi:hypothetical protein
MNLRALFVLSASLLLALPALIGCENDCQRMCREFADIYEECGIDYGDSELRDCIQEYRVPDTVLLDTVCAYGMQSHPDHGTTLRADMISSADEGNVCTTLEDWQRTVGTSG